MKGNLAKPKVVTFFSDQRLYGLSLQKDAKSPTCRNRFWRVALYTVRTCSLQSSDGVWISLSITEALSLYRIFFAPTILLSKSCPFYGWITFNSTQLSLLSIPKVITQLLAKSSDAQLRFRRIWEAWDPRPSLWRGHAPGACKISSSNFIFRRRYHFFDIKFGRNLLDGTV